MIQCLPWGHRCCKPPPSEVTCGDTVWSCPELWQEKVRTHWPLQSIQCRNLYVGLYVCNKKKGKDCYFCEKTSASALQTSILIISIISRGEYKLLIWRYIHFARAWLLSSPSLPSWQVNMAESCWMEFSFIRKKSLPVQDIWKDRKFLNWLLSLLDPNSFQELAFKTFKNR